MRCAVYIRVSTDKEEQKASLKNQKELFVNYISEKDWDIHEFYVDIESGTTDKREQLQLLIEDAKAKKFDVILAKELSRLARNGELSYQIKRIAEQHRIHIITLDGAINTLNGTSDMFGLYAWIYEQESQRTSERVKASLDSRARRGLFKGSIPPYGYHCVEGKLFIRQDNTPYIVKRIFREYLSGKGFDAIARELYNKGITTPAQLANKSNASDKWHGSTIKNILENAHYTGDLVQGRTTTKSVTSKIREEKNSSNFIVVENTHEAIISKEDFETAQQLMTSRKRSRPQVEKHIFTNTLFCADCGRGMHYKKNSKGYICGNYNKHGSKACSNHLTKESDLVEAILNDLNELASSINNQSHLNSLQSKLQKQKQAAKKKIDSNISEIEKLKSKKKKTLSLLVEEAITKEDYNEFIKEMNERITNAEEEVEDLRKRIQSQHEDKNILDELQQKLSSLMLIKELTPDILHRFIDKIEITADGKAKVHYRTSAPTAFYSIRVINAQHSTCAV